MNTTINTNGVNYHNYPYIDTVYNPETSEYFLSRIPVGCINCVEIIGKLSSSASATNKINICTPQEGKYCVLRYFYKNDVAQSDIDTYTDDQWWNYTGSSSDPIKIYYPPLNNALGTLTLPATYDTNQHVSFAVIVYFRVE